jgi:hypothetical protein
MSKNKNKRRKGAAKIDSSPSNVISASAQPAAARPRVIFAAGDADFGYTEGKIWRLAARLKNQAGCNVVALTHDEEALTQARKLMLATERVTMESPGVTVMERLQATDELIRETANLNIPGSRLPLWKVLAMDDFLGSLQLYGAQPSASVDADAVIVPLMGVDNNTKATCGVYTWLVSEARRKGIPVVAIEISPVGNKNTLAHLPADYFAVKTEWSRQFLIREGLARPDQIGVLKWDESYLLWPGKDEYTEAFLEHEMTMREALKIPPDRFVILIPHHVAFMWEVRRILHALARLDLPLTVVIRVEARTTRRNFPERELVMETYVKEIRALPHIVVDERVGVGLLLQLADLVISPFAGTTTERTALSRKPTIICQAMGEEGWAGDSVYWEPNPDKIVDHIHEWQRTGRLERRSLADIIGAVLSRVAKPQSENLTATSTSHEFGDGVAPPFITPDSISEAL